MACIRYTPAKEVKVEDKTDGSRSRRERSLLVSGDEGGLQRRISIGMSIACSSLVYHPRILQKSHPSCLDAILNRRFFVSDEFGYIETASASAKRYDG